MAIHLILLKQKHYPPKKALISKLFNNKTLKNYPEINKQKYKK